MISKAALLGGAAARGVAVLLACACVPAAGRNVVDWVLYDAPPASMPVNDAPGNGMADQALRLVLARWPDAEHRYIVANPKRFWSMMEAGEPVCTPAVLKTAQHDRLAYLSPMAAVPPFYLLTRAELAPQLPRNRAGEIRLDLLLRERRWQGLLVEERSYGPQSDRLIAADKGRARLAWNSPSTVGASNPRMVGEGRADWTIEFDFTLAHQQRGDPQLTQLVSLPIAGNQTFLVYFACPRTPWGRAAIARIDAILAEPAVARGMRAIMRAALRQDSWRRHAPALDRYFSQRSAWQAPAGAR
ncbi:MAG: TIGR02285 family protein [Pseudomonadota bacterium]